MIEIKNIYDYKKVQILGLQPNDRAPNDYLRFTSRIFNSFKPIDPTKTISSYINGFETTVIKNDVELQFNISKGSCFIDDQFIAFTDDMLFSVPMSSIVDNVSYYLVLKYQYTNQIGPNPAIFELVTTSTFDESKMLNLLEFQLSSGELVTVPQNLEDKFIQNYSKLFDLVTHKAEELFEINTYQGIDITKDKVYKNLSDDKYSTKSGDVVFLDLDGLYKPARACNRRIDKAVGIYIYNNRTDSHTVVTNGLIEFNQDIEIDETNKILINAEPGKTYYLLDNCSETSYAWENGIDKISGKISSRFIPGNVKIGFALTNNTFMVDITFADELNTANFLELIGLPDQFQERFNIIYSYWNYSNSKDFRELFSNELRLLKEKLSNQKNDLLLNKESLTNDTDSLFDSYAIVSNPSTNDLTTLKNNYSLYNKEIIEASSEKELKTFRTEDTLNNLEKIKIIIDSDLLLLNDQITYLDSFINNFNSLSYSDLYFSGAYQIPSFYSSIVGFEDFSSLALPRINRFDLDTQSISVPTIKESSDAPDGNLEDSSTRNISSTKYNLVLRSAVGETSSGSVSTSTTQYSSKNEVISSIDSVAIFKNNSTVLLNILKNIQITLNNISGMFGDLIQNVENDDIEGLSDCLDPNGDKGPSIILYRDTLKNYIIENNLVETISSSFGAAKYLDNIGYFLDQDNNILDINEFISKNEYAVFKDYFIINFLSELITNHFNFLENYSPSNITSTYISNEFDKIDSNYLTYLDDKNETYLNYQNSMKNLNNIIDEITTIDLDTEFINNRILSEDSIISNLINEITALDSQIVSRIKNSASVNSIITISEFERKVYNYTYLTIRIRLKQKLLESINKDIKLINETLLELKNQTVPDKTLIAKLQLNLDSFMAVKNNLELELEGMVLEYNNLRISFGIDDPVLITDTDFNDYGIADPNLECFQTLKTF